MKKIKYVVAISLIVMLTMLLTGCNSDKVLKQLEEKGYFSNNYSEAIAQTKIADIVLEHFKKANPEAGVEKKKALLITIDGMRAESLSTFYDYGYGIAKVADTGGLYWTVPDNLDTKAKIDLGVNFLGIVTGKEPSTFNVLKSTDPKYAEPASIMSTIAKAFQVKFITDNQNYLDVQLAQELKTNTSGRLQTISVENIPTIEKTVINSLNNTDFLSVAISEPYFKAGQNFKLSNEKYLSSILNINHCIDKIVSQIEKRKHEDWLIIVTTTCGGMDAIGSKNDYNNILTFMATNKAR